MSPALVSGAIALVVVAWLAACAEAGLARVSSFRAEEAVRTGRRGSAKLAQIAADPTRYLNVALLVRVACEMAAAALVTYACLREFDGTTKALLAAIGVMVLVSYVAVGVSPRTRPPAPAERGDGGGVILLPLARIMGPIRPSSSSSVTRSPPARASVAVPSPPRRSCARWSISRRRSR
ncbi:hypothetical protein SALBM311S_03621 [Streptomyces alboniger]